MASQTEVVQVIVYLQDFDTSSNQWVIRDSIVVDQIGTEGSGTSAGGGSSGYLNLAGSEWLTFDLSSCQNKSAIRFVWKIRVVDTFSAAKASGLNNYGNHWFKWEQGTGVFMGGKK